MVGAMDLFLMECFKMALLNPVVYFRQVKAEMKKVTWPTRKETTVSAAWLYP